LGKEQRLTDFHEALENWQSREEPRLKEIDELLEKGQFSLSERDQLRQMDTAMQALGYQSEEHERRRQAEREARTAEEDYRRLESARTSVASLEREIATLQASQIALAQSVERNEASLKELDST
jgi:predicted RNase H-like nuclease (RuvC/YqgF family)